MFALQTANLFKLLKLFKVVAGIDFSCRLKMATDVLRTTEPGIDLPSGDAKASVDTIPLLDSGDTDMTKVPGTALLLVVNYQRNKFVMSLLMHCGHFYITIIN